MSPADVIGLDERPDLVTAEPADGAGLESTARAVAYGEEPALPPMPDGPELPAELFRPPAAPPLALALDEPSEPASPPAARPGVSWSRLVPAGVLAGVVVALGAIGWLAFEPAGERAGHRPPSARGGEADPPPEVEAAPVRLLVETTPHNALIYVDDELHPERPIEVPRSDEYRRVRVEAEGYAPRTIQVQPLRDRRLEVALDREVRARRAAKR